MAHGRNADEAAALRGAYSKRSSRSRARSRCFKPPKQESFSRFIARVSLAATPHQTTARARLFVGEAIALAILAVLALRTMLTWILRIPASITWDYGPAQLAICCDMMRRGAPMYRDFRVAPFVPLVYGPVIPAITSRLAPLFGVGPPAALAAGRVLTIASSIAVAVLIFFLARRIGASIIAAILAALAFIVSPIVLRWGFEYRVDMPGLAFELGGILAFAGGAPASAIALFVISFFTKQANAIGIVTVVLLCWISGARRRAFSLALIWLAAVAAGTALLIMMYPYYLLNAFGAVRTRALDFSAPIFFGGILVGGSVGLILFAIIAVTRRIVNDRLTLLFLIVATVQDLASCLRWGSNAYYFLPALAALTIVASLGIDSALRWIRGMSAAPQFALGIALALLLSMGFFLAPSAITGSLVAADPWDPRALATLHSIDGPILTDIAELKLVDAQPNLQWIDLMVLTSMQQLGTFDDASLVSAVEHREIAAFALDDEGLGRSFRGRALFWPRLRQAIEANYDVVPGVGVPHIMTRKGSRQNTKTSR
jgi:hypothetical protein